MRTVSFAVEGRTDAPIAEKLLRTAGFLPEGAVSAGGKSKLDPRLTGLNQDARHRRWFVLRDLDQDPCAAELARFLVPAPSRYMCFRLAVRSVESWLLADRHAMARQLHVAVEKLPSAPDELEQPKRTLVDLARKSRSRLVREELVPAPGTSALVGPAYTSWMESFVRETWNPHSAASLSPSLARCLAALTRLP